MEINISAEKSVGIVKETKKLKKKIKAELENFDPINAEKILEENVVKEKVDANIDVEEK